MKKKPRSTGILAVASPVPCLILTTLWFWLWYFGIGGGIMNLDPIPDWISLVGMIPLAISPIFCLVGIIHGLVKIKKRTAGLGILLSVIGLIENAIIIYGIVLVGSSF